MLVLSRKVGEKVVVDGGKIEIKILAQRGNQVALGILAPDNVSIDRQEIYHQKLRKQAKILTSASI